MFKVYSIGNGSLFKDPVAIHPDNLIAFEYYLHNVEKELDSYMDIVYKPSILTQIDIRQDKNVPRFARKWQFPVTRFVEYSPEDVEWARPIGFCYEVDDRDTLVAFCIGKYKLLKSVYPYAEILESLRWQIYSNPIITINKSVLLGSL